MNVATPIIEQILYFFLCGIFIGLSYEILRILRSVIKHNNLLIGTEDVLFFALCGFLLFGLSMNIGNGQFRLMYLISAAVGAFVYYFTMGKLFNLVYSTVLKWLMKALRFILSPFAKLISIIVLKIKRLFVRIYKKCILLYKNTFRHLKNSTKKVYNNTYVKREGSAENDVGVKIKAKVKK